MRPLTALLARPHPAIVEAMTSAAVASGLTPHPLSSREELLRWPSRDVALIVVSTSVSSAVHDSFEEVIRAARHAHPTAPLVIATVVDTEHARKLLSDMLVLYRIDGRLRTAAEIADPIGGHCNDHDILLVNRGELDRTEDRAQVIRAMRHLVRGSMVGT